MRLIARNLGLVILSRGLEGGVRFLTVPLVLGYFGRSDFGLIALAFSMHVFLSVTEWGISVNAVRRMTELLAEQRHADLAALVHSAGFFYTLIGAFNLAAVLVAGYFGQAWFALDDRQASAFAWMMWSLGLASALTWSFSIYRQVLHASSQVGWDEAVNLISTALTVLVVLATLHWRLSPQWYFTLVLVPPLVPMVLRVRRAQKTVPGLRLGLQRNWGLFRPLVGTSLWLFGLSLADLVSGNYRNIIVAQQLGLASVADFRIITQVTGFATLLLSGVMSVAYPVIAKLDAANDQTRLSMALTQGSRLLLWLHLGLLTSMAFLAELMLRLYIGPDFVRLAGPLAVSLLALFAYHNSLISSLVIARGKLSVMTLSAMLNALLTLVAAHLFAPRFGLDAVIWTYCIYMALQLVVLYALAVPLAGAGNGAVLALRVMLRPVLCTAVAAALAWWAARATQLETWFCAVVFVPLFVLLALTLGGVLQDVQALRRRGAPA